MSFYTLTKMYLDIRKYSQDPAGQMSIVKTEIQEFKLLLPLQSTFLYALKSMFYMVADIYHFKELYEKLVEHNTTRVTMTSKRILGFNGIHDTLRALDRTSNGCDYKIYILDIHKDSLQTFFRKVTIYYNYM